MRKSLIVLAVLLVLSVGGIALAHGAVTAWQDDVVITETTLLGNVKAAEGLMLSTRYHLDRQAFWSTSFQAAADPRPETEFDFYYQEQYSEIQPSQTINLYPASMNFGIMGDDIDLEERRDRVDYGSGHMQMDPAIDVASRTGAGETHTETIRLADYYEFYAMDMDLYSMPGVYDPTDAEWKRFCDGLTERFAIPVLEEEMVTVTITKADDGAITGVECYSEGGGTAFGSGIWSEDGIWLYLNGTPEELSQLQDGFGLYHIPWETVYRVYDSASWYYVTIDEVGYLEDMTEKELENRAALRPDLAKTENIYPLDVQTCQFLHLIQTEDNELLLLTMERDVLVLTLLETDGTVIQRLELPEFSFEETYYTVWQSENDLLVLSAYYEERDQIAVLSRLSGSYELWLTQALPDNDVWPIGYYTEPVMAFDGQRLAMVFPGSWGVCSIRVVSFDKTGLNYAGFYHHNGDTVNQMVDTDWHESVTAVWR